MHEPSDITELLDRARRGDERASAALLNALYGELRRSAERMMRSEHAAHTLQATALVHEAWLKLSGVERWSEVNDPAHLLKLAARAMRNVLIDHARAKQRLKRGSGAEREPLDLLIDTVTQGRQLDVLALHEALGRFAAFDEQGAQIVELKFFGGLSIDEVARTLDLSTATVERGWRVARLWLARELGDGALET